MNKQLNFIKHLLIISAIILVFSANLFSQPVPDVKGEWTGSIHVPGNDLGVIVKFTKAEKDSLKGTIDIPMQNAKNIHLINIKQDITNITFEITGAPGKPTFIGKISDDNKEISGDFRQAGQNFAFNLKRKDELERKKESVDLAESLQKIRTFIDTTMKAWKVPGLAICIVKDGKVILSEGFGYRNVKEKLPVTSNTLFAIGSSTKAFTAMSIGILVDEGKLDWDKPVKNYYPSFKMYDNFATERMTLRDLVTHRSGLPRHDLMWYGSKLTRKELVDRLQYLEPNKDFRTEFQYQNLMFATAGYIAGLVANSSWEEIARDRIFKPLGMENSNFSVLASQKSKDYALPYSSSKEEVNEMPFRDIGEIGPAGSINSCADDMSKWLMLHLNNGKVGEKQIISPACLKQMHSPYMAISTPPEFLFESSYASYGLGWFIQSYKGHNKIQHGGNIDGFSALVSFLPQDNMGIVVLTNMNGAALPSIVSLFATDILLKLEPSDWHGMLLAKTMLAKKSGKKENEKDADRVSGTKPSHKFFDYAGEYENPAYGILTIDYNEKNLIAKFNSFTVDLAHWHYDIFKGIDKKNENFSMMFSFFMDRSGNIDRLTLPLEPQVKEIVFTRKTSNEMASSEYLSRFVGDYDLDGKIIKFTLKGNILVCTVPNQPSYDLEPNKKDEFKLKGLVGYNVKFTIDGKNAVTEATFKQPNGNFSGKRK